MKVPKTEKELKRKEQEKFQNRQYWSLMKPVTTPSHWFSILGVSTNATSCLQQELLSSHSCIPMYKKKTRKINKELRRHIPQEPVVTYMQFKMLRLSQPTINMNMYIIYKTNRSHWFKNFWMQTSLTDYLQSPLNFLYNVLLLSTKWYVILISKLPLLYNFLIC